MFQQFRGFEPTNFNPLQFVSCGVCFEEHGLYEYLELSYCGQLEFQCSIDVLSLHFSDSHKNVAFFFWLAFHSASTNFCCTSFFHFSTFSLYIFPQLHLSPFSLFNSGFSKCLSFLSVPLLLSEGPSLLQGIGNQLTGVVSVAMLPPCCSSKEMEGIYSRCCPVVWAGRHCSRRSAVSDAQPFSHRR